MIKRDKYLAQLVSSRENGFPKVITGIRRCGKSYLLKEIYKEYLISQNVDDALTAISGKGVTVPSGSTSVSLSTLIGQIITPSDVVHYYTGSTAPSSSLGSNGDIYLQT